MERERLIREALESLRVTPEATAHYIKTKDALLDEINAQMTAHPQIATLIGGNTMSMMQDNHRNHIDFMSTVFQFNSFELLVKTVPWVYRSYRAHGFPLTISPGTGIMEKRRKETSRSRGGRSNQCRLRLDAETSQQDDRTFRGPPRRR